jgi:hypothetical protein
VLDRPLGARLRSDALQSRTFRLYSSAAAPVTGAAQAGTEFARLGKTKFQLNYVFNTSSSTYDELAVVDRQEVVVVEGR